jgi:hypothetical protein
VRRFSVKLEGWYIIKSPNYAGMESLRLAQFS